MAGTHTDVTERRRVQDALQVSLAGVQRHHAQMVALNRLNDLLLSCQTRAEAYAIVAHSGGRLFAGCSGALALSDDTAGATQLRVVAAWGRPDSLPVTFAPCDCWALRRGALHAVVGATEGAQCPHVAGPPPAASLCVPLTVRAETLGLLHVRVDAAPTAVPFEELRTLAIAGSEAIKLILSNLRLQEALREQTIRDALTGLFNRRYLDETLPRELQRCRRRGEPLAVAMLDVDHFKRFNDAHGHAAGDRVLQAVGALLNASLRAGDLACRYGGEELTLILPDCPLEAAQARLEGLRVALGQLRLPAGDTDLPSITVSIGVAVADAREDAAALLGRADAALYRAKADGRNRLALASGGA